MYDIVPHTSIMVTRTTNSEMLRAWPFWGGWMFVFPGTGCVTLRAQTEVRQSPEGGRCPCHTQRGGPNRKRGAARLDVMTRCSRELLSVSYSSLLDRDADLSQIIRDAYGSDGLGILAVSDVPGFPDARARLLPLASKLASLPAEKLAALEDATSGFNFGWSHGKERLEKDKPGAEGDQAARERQLGAAGPLKSCLKPACACARCGRPHEHLCVMRCLWADLSCGNLLPPPCALHLRRPRQRLVLRKSMPRRPV